MRASAGLALHDQRDQQLLLAAAGGDTAAWAVLVERHGEPVWAMAERLVGPERADEVSQLVWLRLASHLGDPHGAGTTGTWLRIAVWDECARQRQVHPLAGE